MSKEKIRFAVIGYGHIGKRHTKIISQHKDCELVAVCDNEYKPSLNEFPESVSFFNTVDLLLNSDLDYHIVCICTPNGWHKEHSIKSLSKGKHVVIEKPMALHKSDCEEILFKALSVTKQVFIVMQNRYSSPIVWLKNMLNNKLLGSVYFVQMNTYWNRDDRYYKDGLLPHRWHGTKNMDGGVLFTQFAHFIDIMYWLFGDIENIQTKTRNFNHQQNTEFDDTGTSTFDFINGGIGNFNFTTSVQNKNFESSITVIGEKGTVKIGGQYMDKVEYCEITDYELPELESVNPPNVYNGYTGSAANHHYIFQNIVDVLKHKKSITTNAVEGMKVVDIIERIYKGV